MTRQEIINLITEREKQEWRFYILMKEEYGKESIQANKYLNRWMSMYELLQDITKESEEEK